jgi:plasmid stabilization system protein ParE
MSDYIVAPQAGEDVFHIWRHLYRRAGLDVANRVESELYRSHTRTDLTSRPVHFFAVYSYMIVYRSREPLEIVRVLHGRRNLRRILRWAATKSDNASR